MSDHTHQTFVFAEFEVDPARRRLLHKGEQLPLYAKTFDLLAFLESGLGKPLPESVLAVALE